MNENKSEYLYRFALIGQPSKVQIEEITEHLERALQLMKLNLGVEIGFEVMPAQFEPAKTESVSVLYFGPSEESDELANKLLSKNIPIVPVVSEPAKVTAEIPPFLRQLNCLDYSVGGAERAVSAVLECSGLLPKQRHVFLSYKRDESRAAALQLYEALSSRQFSVFIDTHGISPGSQFQDQLWHELCGSDVLLMLDTPNYFESQWTVAEFGRAMAKNISILRVGWPDVQPSRYTQLAEGLQLSLSDFVKNEETLNADAIQIICREVEHVRSKSLAIRRIQLISKVRKGIEAAMGTFNGVGEHSGLHLNLFDGSKLIVYPIVGIPTSKSLHDAESKSGNIESAVVYDEVGIHVEWKNHIEWLSQHVTTCKWIKAHEASWQFCGWGA